MSSFNPISYLPQSWQHYCQENAEPVKRSAKLALVHAGTHALGAWIFTSVNPFAAAIIGGISYVATKEINRACRNHDIYQATSILRTTQRAISVVAGMALGSIAAKAVGFKVGFMSAIAVKVSVLALYIFAAGLALALFGALIYAVYHFGGNALSHYIPKETKQQIDNFVADVKHRVAALVHNNVEVIDQEAAHAVGEVQQTFHDVSDALDLSKLQ